MSVAVRRTRVPSVVADLPDEVAGAVSKVLAPLGQRLTRHRTAVLAVLADSDRPLTTDEVVERSGVPTSTAYRNLAELVDLGVIARVGGVDRIERHELSEHYSRRHHHHLVCVDCGAVADFDASPALERLIADETSAILDAAGFEVTQHVFDVRGRCADCRS